MALRPGRQRHFLMREAGAYLRSAWLSMAAPLVRVPFEPVSL
jgi:hypothetical protein